MSVIQSYLCQYHRLDSQGAMAFGLVCTLADPLSKSGHYESWCKHRSKGSGQS